MTNYDFCISSYLAFRYVAKPGIGWKNNVVPEFPNLEALSKYNVNNAQETLEILRRIISESIHGEKLGILLSGGIDSAIIAALLPRGTRAYTIRFISQGAIDESPMAGSFAEILGLEHTVVDVTWDDYDDCMDLLMRRKKAPLHPVEVGVYKASCTAHNDGIYRLLTGNVADSTFGGFDKLLSKDWTFDEFVARYFFLDPSQVVKRPVSMVDIFEPYRLGNTINVMGFLKVVHGLGIIQMFENAVHAGGCSLITPFAKLVLDTPLDLQRIRNGEPKYILNEIFHGVYPELELPIKIPFARPMTEWLDGWHGPKRSEFHDDLIMDHFTGEQKWQLYCLERFLNLLDDGTI